MTAGRPSSIAPSQATAYLWIDTTYLKVRRGGRIVSVAAIMDIGVNSDGRREILGMQIGTSEAEPIWTEFRRKLSRRGFSQGQVGDLWRP